MMQASSWYSVVSTYQSLHRPGHPPAEGSGYPKSTGRPRWQLIIQFLEKGLLVAISMLLAITVLTFLATPFSRPAKQRRVIYNRCDPAKPCSGRAVSWCWSSCFQVSTPALLDLGTPPMEALKNKLSTGRTNGLSLRRVLVVRTDGHCPALITGVIIAIAPGRLLSQRPHGF